MLTYFLIVCTYTGGGRACLAPIETQDKQSCIAIGKGYDRVTGGKVNFDCVPIRQVRSR